jgi:ankyrin repeat protein
MDLNYLLSENKTELAEILISKGADVNVRDKYRSTPLLKVCWKQNIELAKILISKGADVDIIDSNQYTPLTVAYPNIELAEILISKGADVNYQSHDGFTLLHYAAMYYGPELVKFYLSKGSNINSNNVHNKYRTPLYCACAHNNIQTVELLLSEGANIHRTDDYERSPLHIAARFGYIELVKLLLSKGAKVNGCDRIKNTPLTYAYLCYIEASKPSLSGKFQQPLYIEDCEKYLEITNLLISNGADVICHNKDFKSHLYDDYQDLYIKRK